jgi:hypothetical protein
LDITNIHNAIHSHGAAAPSRETNITALTPSREDQAAKIREQVEIEKLKTTEREVVAHEQAHSTVGGRFAGAPSYTYTTGPGGKRYITGGEVSISISSGKTPEETVRNMKQVRAAALAPANPSAADLAVASRASAIEASASNEASKERNAEASESKDPDNEPTTTKIDAASKAYEGAQVAPPADLGEIISLII